MELAALIDVTKCLWRSLRYMLDLVSIPATANLLGAFEQKILSRQTSGVNAPVIAVDVL